jgi:hypothetical protein
MLGAGLPVLALSLVLAGCGGGDNKTSSDKPSGDSSTTTDKDKSAKGGDWKALEAGKGVIKGKVTVKGTADPKFIAGMNQELMELINKNTNKDFCLSGSEAEKQQQSYIIDDKGNVANVFVWIAPADKTTYFKIDKPEEFAKEVEIDQPHCAFIPHVAVLFPEYRDPTNPKKLKATNQKVIVRNTAPQSHNTKWGDGNKNQGDNKILAPKETMELSGIVVANDPIKLTCNIHGWMDAYLRSFDHPYATTTKPDGTFEIKGVPTGAKLKIFAWHEKAGDLAGKAGQEIEVKDEPLTKDFQLEVK